MIVKILILMILLITRLGISAPPFPQLLKPEWEDVGIASIVILNTSYDKVWESTLDVLLFGKFKIRGVKEESKHEAITVEKDTGLIIIKGSNSMGEEFQYTFKATLHKEDCNIMLYVRSDSPWRKRIVEKFFELFEREFTSSSSLQE